MEKTNRKICYDYKKYPIYNYFFILSTLLVFGFCPFSPLEDYQFHFFTFNVFFSQRIDVNWILIDISPKQIVKMELFIIYK